MIGADRSITFTTDIQIIGEYATRLRTRIPRLSNDDTDLFYRNLFSDSKLKLAIVSHKVLNLEDFNQPLIIKLTGQCTRLADHIKNEIFCKPMFLDQPGSYEKVGMKHRTLPINLYYPDRLEHELSISWDSSLGVDSVSLPENIRLVAPFGSLTFESVRDSTGIRISYTKEYTDYRIEAEELDEFRNFQKSLQAIAGQYLTLVQKL